MKTVKVDSSALYLRLNDEENMATLEPVISEPLQRWLQDNEVDVKDITPLIGTDDGHIAFFIEFHNDTDSVAFKLGWDGECETVPNRIK
jgi:hypothetical protein